MSNGNPGQKCGAACFAAWLILCGCERKSNDYRALAERVAKLEERTTGLEAEAAATKLQGNRICTNEMDLAELFRNYQTTNYNAAWELSIKQLLLQDQVDNMQMVLSNYFMTVHAPQAPRLQRKATSERDGVPIEIYNIISAEAARRYPTDYSMQQFIINEQVEAYKKLHSP